MLYHFQTRNINTDIPCDIAGQATYWKTYYNTRGVESNFIDASNQLEQGCSTGAGVDLVFLLDDSYTVTASNFEKMKSFTRDVINGFDVGAVSVCVCLLCVYDNDCVLNLSIYRRI